MELKIIIIMGIRRLMIMIIRLKVRIRIKMVNEIKYLSNVLPI